MEKVQPCTHSFIHSFIHCMFTECHDVPNTEPGSGPTIVTHGSLPVILASWQDNKYTAPNILSVVAIARSGRRSMELKITRGTTLAVKWLETTCLMGQHWS